jgi:7-carboxy-7-deazaguanine synthase
MNPGLRITEIFLSLQGEARAAGRPTVFVRLTGCPLRCTYCDTAYAFSGGLVYQEEQVLAEVASHGVEHVCVTGGEPLAQPGCISLLQGLCEAGHAVSLETSGAMDIAEVDDRVSRVLDLKTPGSGEMERNMLANIALLRRHDQIKFVICDERDYEWSVSMLREHALERRVSDVLFSPVHGSLPARQLADWIVRDRLPVRFQIQLHKYLWDDARGK